ncbi:MAG: hypothetical protein ACI4MC_00225 [Candidatus Coproplasma sp.]
MGIFKKKKKDETAVTAVTSADDTAQDNGEDFEYIEPKAKQERQKKKNIFNTIGDITETVKGFKSSFDEVYSTWIKPIMDNRAQIKRRWNWLVTTISVVFFLLYVPILLFTKIAKGLSLGWDIALYTCIGVYVAAVIVMIIITVASGKSTSTQASKRWRRASSIILFVVRIASFALSITAIVVSGVGESGALDMVLMVLAITSIVFTSLSLIFGGAVGFFKWLISPAKIRRRFSSVAFEWKQTLDEGKREQDKKVKKAYAKNVERVAGCLDNYLLPSLGKAYIDAVDGDKIMYILSALPEEDRNICEWIFKDLFDYALSCRYVPTNPCEELNLEGDIARERPPKRRKEEGSSSRNIFASIFKRRSTPDQAAEEEDSSDGVEE